MIETADQLGVLTTTRRVVDEARWAHVGWRQVESVADALAARPASAPTWDAELHFSDGTARTAQWILVLDALNFCFWGEPRWETEYRGRWRNGYWALATALKRATEEGVPILDASWLAELDLPRLSSVLRGRGEIPLLAERVENLREVGRVLLERYRGQFADAVEAAGHSAVSLVRLLGRDFRSFDDTATYRGQEVRFYKRAQICAADLAGSFGGRGWGRFDDLLHLSALADYKVPQVLRRLGLLEYAPELASVVDARTPIPAGSEEEVEIRAATIWAVEELRRAVSLRGVTVSSIELDWLLWSLGQEPSPDDRPYHRTRTIYY